jgi:threonine synthase
MDQNGWKVHTDQNQANECMKISCISCGNAFDFKRMDYLCPKCGGIFDISNFPVLDLDKVDAKRQGLMRYLYIFGLDQKTEPLTLNEGGTRLIEDEFENRRIFHKMESLNPTGSYKDRGSVVLINYLKQNGIKTVVEDSSGNAGASFAAYAALAGIKARIFVPESASGPKRKQIEDYGAELVSIPGPRVNAAKAVRTEADRGVVYASHAYMPMGLLGIATIAFEVFESITEEINSVIIPIGHGGLMLGIMRGYISLLQAGYIYRLPKFVGVQAELCSPVANLLSSIENSRVNSRITIAEGVRVTEPVRGQAVADLIKKNNGMIIRVGEDMILPAFEELKKRGIDVEPTSALTWAGLKLLPDEAKGPVLLIQTGAGYKYQPL